MSDTVASHRKPEWLKVRLNTTDNYHFLKKLMRAESLHTVCEEARCPNLQECWGTHRTASFMILGDTCTRRCRFCAVNTGLPGAVDKLEPVRVAAAVERMKLSHVHVTMVNRDDLPDGGASIMAATVRAIRWRSPECSVEVLTSDFMGSEEAVGAVVESTPDIISHNVETVRRLTPRVRSRSSYDRSLEFLRIARRLAPGMVTKSSVMLGLGESFEEVEETLSDLRLCGVDVVNIGQYLQPTRNHIPVRRYWTPEEFRQLKDIAMEKGFLYCESGPFVRSSYHADAQFQGFQQHLSQLRSERRVAKPPVSP
ncbi:MAG TPA: lipoyl synthase [Spirochaetia bacterium]|nr:lipoyl synthase [Spirochaetia bacterium]